MLRLVHSRCRGDKVARCAQLRVHCERRVRLSRGAHVPLRHAPCESMGMSPSGVWYVAAGDSAQCRENQWCDGPSRNTRLLRAAPAHAQRQRATRQLVLTRGAQVLGGTHMPRGSTALYPNAAVAPL